MAALTECEDCVWPKPEVVGAPALFMQQSQTVEVSAVQQCSDRLAGERTDSSTQWLQTLPIAQDIHSQCSGTLHVCTTQ
jgi:hypothetical protein